MPTVAFVALALAATGASEAVPERRPARRTAPALLLAATPQPTAAGHTLAPSLVARALARLLEWGQSGKR